MIFLSLFECMLGPGIPPGNLDPKCPSISQQPTGKLKGKEGPGTPEVTVTGHYSQLRWLTALPPRCPAANTLCHSQGQGLLRVLFSQKKVRVWGQSSQHPASCCQLGELVQGSEQASTSGSHHRDWLKPQAHLILPLSPRLWPIDLTLGSPVSFTLSFCPGHRHQAQSCPQ